MARRKCFLDADVATGETVANIKVLHGDVLGLNTKLNAKIAAASPTIQKLFAKGMASGEANCTHAGRSNAGRVKCAQR